MAATITHADRANGPEFDWGAIRWLCSSEIDADAEMTFGIVFINPGEANPRHMHPNCEEIIYLLSGKCDHQLGDEWHALEAGMMLRIPRGVDHCARNTGWEAVRMIITYSSPDRETIFYDE